MAVEKFINRKAISGEITELDGINFSLKAPDKLYDFSLNENVEYKHRKNGEISICNGFNLVKGRKYNVVFTPEAKPRVEIML